MAQEFFTGDVVKYIGKSTAWKKDQIHIIYECDYQGQGNFEYSTTRGAWFCGSDFKLIRRADAKSMSRLDVLMLDLD